MNGFDGIGEDIFLVLLGMWEEQRFRIEQVQMEFGLELNSLGNFFIFVRSLSWTDQMTMNEDIQLVSLNGHFDQHSPKNSFSTKINAILFQISLISLPNIR